jgi:hypothetical protein
LTNRRMRARMSGGVGGGGPTPPPTRSLSLQEDSGQKPRARQRAWPGYGAIPGKVRTVTEQIPGATGHRRSCEALDDGSQVSFAAGDNASARPSTTGNLRRRGRLLAGVGAPGPADRTKAREQIIQSAARRGAEQGEDPPAHRRRRGEGWGSLTGFSRTDRTALDCGIYAGQVAGL